MFNYKSSTELTSLKYNHLNQFTNYITQNKMKVYQKYLQYLQYGKREIVLTNTTYQTPMQRFR